MRWSGGNVQPLFRSTSSFVWSLDFKDLLPGEWLIVLPDPIDELAVGLVDGGVRATRGNCGSPPASRLSIGVEARNHPRADQPHLSLSFMVYPLPPAAFFLFLGVFTSLSRPF